MRIQFVPFPRMKPRQPSSRPIFTKAFQIDNLYSVRPTLWTWRRIFNRSSGDTIVLETAPATPPAINAATTGSARFFLVRTNIEGVCSLISSCFKQPVSLSAHIGGWGSFSPWLDLNQREAWTDSARQAFLYPSTPLSEQHPGDLGSCWRYAHPVTRMRLIKQSFVFCCVMISHNSLNQKNEVDCCCKSNAMKHYWCSTSHEGCLFSEAWWSKSTSLILYPMDCLFQWPYNRGTKGDVDSGVAEKKERKKKKERSSKRKAFAMIGWVVGPELLLFPFTVRNVVG